MPVKQNQRKMTCRHHLDVDPHFSWTYIPYFDPVRMAIIDPMHNLYLGTAKHNILKRVWHERNMIDKRDYASLQECVDSICVYLLTLVGCP